MTNVISVRFRSGSKTYYFDPQGTLVRAGQDVVVETSQGLELAVCAEGNHDVDDAQVVSPLRPLVRIATDNDRRTAAYNRQREQEAFDICQKKIAAHNLEMKLVRVECSFDGSKILFFFTADGRVDFRELVKDLAGVFRSRIELRQIGVRDEAKMLGGLGICGRPFCCNQFMDDFVPVSIKMAKTQNLSLNPTKISGTCGRLMCCLKYEQDAYEDALKRLPKSDSFVQTPDGVGNVTDVNVLKEKVTVRLDERPEAPQCYHNCEVCVLRNGKGSRDGIEIPAQRPQRYVEERKPEETEMPAFFADFTPVSDLPPVEEGGEKRRRRHRGGRKGSEGKSEGVKTEKIAEKPAEKKQADTETPKTEGGEKRRRGHRGGRRNKKPAEAAPQNAPKPTAAPATPKAEGGEGGEKKKRPRHRGGRRHRGHGGGNNSAPKAEG